MTEFFAAILVKRWCPVHQTRTWHVLVNQRILVCLECRLKPEPDLKSLLASQLK